MTHKLKPDSRPMHLMVGLAALLSSCSVYNDISTDYDRSADFSRYHTFAWLPDKDTTTTPYNNPIIRNNTMNYFSHCMGARGMRAEVDTPDVLLDLVVATVKKEATVLSQAYYPSYHNSYYYANPYYYPYPNAYYYRGSYGGFGYSYGNGYSTRKVEYNESTITLNIIDRKANKLVWTGRAVGDLYDPSYIESNLHPAVYDILNDFPIRLVRNHKRPKQ